jgi:hypothetical protein
MITTQNRDSYAVVAMIQEAIAGGFAGRMPLAAIKSADGTSLKQNLDAGQPLPRNLTIDFSPLLDLIHLPRAGDASFGLQSTFNAIADPAGALRRIFMAGDPDGATPNPAAIFARLMEFFTTDPGRADLARTLGSFLEGQFGIALSLATTLRNLADPSLPRVIADACLEYFFAADGYTTIDAIHLRPPLAAGGATDGNPSQRNADRYVRDLITVIVEASGNVQYGLRDRLARALALFPAARHDAAMRWFSGFGAMAEAGVMAAVEETLRGIGQFQGNAIVAAAGGAYAGTAARKATQHVFLSELGV